MECSVTSLHWLFSGTNQKPTCKLHKEKYLITSMKEAQTFFMTQEVIEICVDGVRFKRTFCGDWKVE